MTIVYVTHFLPSASGHGGNHRAYQILHDLHSAVGSDHVRVLCLREWQQAQPSLSVSRILSRVEAKCWSYAEKLLPIQRGTRPFSGTITRSQFSRAYRSIIGGTCKPTAVVIEHTGFSHIAKINRRLGIRTIVCPQNLESLDTTVALPQSRHHIATAARAFASEIHVLSDCDARLFISKVEAGVIGGVGLESAYYPYLPVGEIRDTLQHVRQARADSRQAQDVFLMLGSASHQTTGEGFQWFLEQAQQHGLPPGTRVVIGGRDTERLLPGGSSIPGVEVRGWLRQAELNELLVAARAVFVPQFRGFGALTRIAELACAGVPLVISRHPMFALDIPPGVHIIERSWSEWRTVMSAIAGSTDALSNTWDDYVGWEQSHTNPLIHILQHLN